jgi:hypothetical protein
VLFLPLCSTFKVSGLFFFFFSSLFLLTTKLQQLPIVRTSVSSCSLVVWFCPLEKVANAGGHLGISLSLSYM